MAVDGLVFGFIIYLVNYFSARSRRPFVSSFRRFNVRQTLWPDSLASNFSKSRAVYRRERLSLFRRPRLAIEEWLDIGET